jgi:hypothetical protein
MIRAVHHRLAEIQAEAGMLSSAQVQLIDADGLAGLIEMD